MFFLGLLLINTQAFALDRKASEAISHYIMAGLNEDLGQLDKAIQEYKLALGADNKSPDIHLNLAVAYLKENKIDEAVKELKIVSELDSEAVEPHAILALLYSTQEKNELATGEYELALKNAVKLQPKNVDIYKTLGMVYLGQKKLPAAENTYKMVLELAPNDAEAHFFMGNIYFELKNRNAAIVELKKAVELKPDYPEALNYLGYLYVQDNQNLDQAEGLIRKALAIDPDNGAYVDSLGWLYFKRGKIKEALKELERADKLLDDPEIKEHLKAVQEKLNK